MENSSRLRLGFIVVALLLAGGVLALLNVRTHPPDALVVYCAHDSLYAESILRKFEQETGISIVIRYDTEATKSLGLVNLLIKEQHNPRCDVFWNNQVLGTIDLEHRGLLQPYKGAGYARIPDRYKSPTGAWTGFAARIRVFIVNTNKMPASQLTVEQALTRDLSRMAVAKPLYGTTLSHYRVLWRLMGAKRLKAWHRKLRQGGIREVAGNATVMNLVARGICDFGWTDTDDFFVAKDRGDPVAMIPIRLENKSTICIPNSVAIIRGTKNLTKAQRLIDFLLSAETELALARSKSRQVPLGSIDESRLPPEVKRMQPWVESGYDLSRLGTAREDCLDWLKSEYLR